MGSLTTSKSVPYPVSTDPGDPRFLFDLASWADTTFASYDTTFAAGPRPKAFLLRSTIDGPVASNNNTTGFGYGGSVAIDWDTSGGTVNTTNGVWTQSLSDPQGWWMFGGDLFITVGTGTATIGARMQLQISVTAYDPLTNLPALNSLGDGAQFYNNGINFSGISFATDGYETNSGGEWVNGVTIVPAYHATVSAYLGNFDSGATKKCAAGSTFWGIKLSDA